MESARWAAAGSPRGSPRVPCPPHGGARQAALPHPSGKAAGAIRVPSPGQRGPTLPRCRWDPRASPKTREGSLGIPTAGASAQRVHPPSIPARRRLGTAAASLRCHRPTGRGCAPAPQHPASSTLPRAPAPRARRWSGSEQRLGLGERPADGSQGPP